MHSTRKKTRGQIIVLFTLFVGFLMGFSALAFDVGYAMIVRAELITALDAAALAAIRYVPDGQTAMTNAANRTFEANLPAGKLAIKNPVLTTPVSTTVNGGIDVSLTASADAPTFFARWFGRDVIRINASATTSRRDRNVILVLDYSLSVNPVIGDIRAGAKAFVNSFSETADKVGLVVFSTSGSILVPPQSPFKTTLNNQIDTIGGEFYTDHAMGLYWAYRALLELNDPLKADKLNEIVFFTDGNANWFPGQFLVRTSGSGRCSSSPIRGVFGRNDGGSGAYYADRFFSYTAPAPNGRPPLAPGCTGLSQGDRALQYIQPNWVPDPSPTYGAIVPGGVAMAGFANSNPNLGDSTPTATYTYQPSDTRREQIARNVTDNLARAIRQDPAFDIRIHSIGYNGDAGLNLAVLERIANCQDCPNVSASDANDTSQSKGRFVAASNAADLIDAFLDVAGYIARITY
ncbi:MAG: VWA domain-containing protein [Acidobacteria bacterium]|nr:VWA domain-containing protein [Acidobacteriota bacterium]MDA1234742.1 VWA domain-containing protein [Acidobacteriota bacterium]